MSSSDKSSVAGSTDANALKVAYLVNQYPHVSHSFIRREIAALESQGIAVERFSIRPPPVDLVDPADRAEQAKTRVLLLAGPFGLLLALVLTALRGPATWFAALRAAVRFGRRSERGVLRHVVYLAEACLLLGWLRAAGGVRHVHAHFGTNSAAVAMLTRMLGGPRYSFTVHGPEEFDHPWELSLGEKIERASAVVAISSFGRSQLYRWIPYAQWPKVHVVRCGVDAAFLGAGPQPIADNRRLVCVGRLTEQKGQLLVLEALAALVAEGVSCQIVFAGDGPMRGVVEKRVRELALGTSIRITGWISNEVVREELLGARVMLLASFAEGLPVVLMEAMALGRPVITTAIAGIPELVENGVNGWLIPAGSMEAVVGAIRHALQTPVADLTRMGRAGFAAVTARHDVALEARRLAELFRSVARSHP